MKVILWLIMIAIPSIGVCDDRVRTESIATFNTNCARCHEGECSGRMTFHMSKDVADQHIQRHTGKLSQEIYQELHELLHYMKVECSYYPLDLALSDDGFWSENQLSPLRSHTGKAYFIPLGTLQPNSYNLSFSGPHDSARLCVEIINDEFDFIEKMTLKSDDDNTVLNYQVDESGKYYLRISAQISFNINNIDINLKDNTSLTD